MEKPGNTLNVVLIISGIAATLFGVLGIATMAGWMPHLHTQEAVTQNAPPATLPSPNPAGGAVVPDSQYATHYPSRKNVARGPEPMPEERPGETAVATAGPAPAPIPVCQDCGVVQSINVTEVQSSSPSLVGSVLGGVLGAVVGHQIGNGNGRTLATVAGAAGGAYAGNQIGERVNRHQRYDIHVRMNDGSYRTYYLSAPPSFNTGDRVRLESGTPVLVQ